MDKPYVVSCDIYLLIKEWAKREGFVVPEPEFFGQLRREFSAYMSRLFPGFELVSEEELLHKLPLLVAATGLPTISLDRVYIQSAMNLQVTRLVDMQGNDRGIGPRAGSPPLWSQIRDLQSSGVHEVALVDDVVFTGALIERVVNLLSKIGIRVPVVCVGVGIAEGIRRINHSKREVHCVRRYEEVIDQVCERDFYPGVPLSGRLLVGSKNIGVPYLLPFGNPGKWASIPAEWQEHFSRFCIIQTIRLFKEIERCSNRMVSCAELGRMVATLPQDETKFVDVLRAL